MVLSALPYRVSVGYQAPGRYFENRINYRRPPLLLLLNPTLFDNHLKIDLNLKGGMENTRFGNGGAVGAAISFDPTQPVTRKSPRFDGYYEWLATSPTGLDPVAGRNPVGLLYGRLDESKPIRSIGNLQLDYKLHFLPDLHANVNVGYDYAEGKGTVFVNDSAAQAYVAGGKGGVNNTYKQVRQNKFLELYLNYVKELKSLQSKIDVVAGYSYYEYLTTNYNYANHYADGRVNGSEPNFPFNKPQHNLISFFGRANYSFHDRYLLTATLRRDGSSRFGPKNKWGLFPSVAFAWKVNEESFLKDSRTVSNLKLRLGYGVTGQQDGIGNYDYLSYYSLSGTGASYQFGNTFYQGFRPGGFYADRKWEQTATTNVAVDFGFMNNRISGSVDFYIENYRSAEQRAAASRYKFQCLYCRQRWRYDKQRS